MSDTLENLDKTLSGAIDAVHQLVAQHGEQAVALAGRIYQLQAVSSLLGIVPLSIASAAMGYMAWRAFRMAAPELPKNILDQDDAKLIGGALGGIIASLICVVTLCVGLSRAVDIVAWMSAFDPTVALAAHLLKAL